MESGGHRGGAVTEWQLNQTVFKNKRPVKSQGHGLHYSTRGILKHFSAKVILSGNKIILCWFCILSKECHTALLNEVKGTF